MRFPLGDGGEAKTYAVRGGVDRILFDGHAIWVTSFGNDTVTKISR
jgi:hypothetical protein